MRRIILTILLMLLMIQAIPESTFSGMDLSQSNILLFKLSATYPGFGNYDTLFQSDLTTGELKQLTIFPEQVMLLKATREIQIQNRFGVFRINTAINTVSEIEFFTSFIKNNTIMQGKLPPIRSSPDGRGSQSCRVRSLLRRHG